MEIDLKKEQGKMPIEAYGIGAGLGVATTQDNEGKSTPTEAIGR